MKGLKIIAGLFIMFMATNIYAATMDVTWIQPTQREDATPLTQAEIAMFRVSYGTTTGVYTTQVDVTDNTATTTSISLLPGGTYYVVMSVIDTAGIESVFTPEASIVLNTAAPKSVTGLTLTVGVSPGI